MEKIPGFTVLGRVVFTVIVYLWGGMVLADSLRFAWAPNTDPGVAGYRIHYGVASGAYTFVHDAGNATSTTISNLAPGMTYYFALTAYNSIGVQSDFSPELSFAIPPDLPSPPTALTLTLTPAQQALLTVTGSSNRTYSIEATTNLVTWTSIGSVPIGWSGWAILADTNTLAHPKRFYRARRL